MKKQISNLFPDADGMYERFQSLKRNDPYLSKRELYLRNYNRMPWKRTNKQSCKKQDANFGQFRFKVEAAIGVFINVLTERNSWVKIIPKFPKPGENIKPFSDKITTAFHKYFIRPWEDRFMTEIMNAFDMVMYGKAIEYWPSPACVYSENIPVEDVFPDTNAGLDPKKWSYVFIVKNFTLAELYAIKDATNEERKELAYGEDFDPKYLGEIISDIETYSKSKSDSETSKEIQGEQSSSSRDTLVPIVYLYCKDNFHKENKISLYVFPAEVANYKDSNTSLYPQGTPAAPKVKTLMEKKEYCECLSQVIAVRAYQITRNYWKFNSFAQQIYLATSLYDKSMSLVVRTAKRNSILYVKTDSPDTGKKLMNQTDDEVQVMDSGAEFAVTNGNNNIREVVEVMRQVMIDTENGQSLSQNPGGQNVKGYAITAKEAQIQATQKGESESLNIKILMNKDVALHKELYRRAIDVGTSPKFAKSLKLFKEEMEALSVPKEYYEYENVYFVPSYLNGGNQYARVQNAQGVLQVLSKAPGSPGEEQAQRDIIAAFVGVENVDAYIQNRLEVNPVLQKAGSENEDLDNPYANPANLQVLPTDKHLQELPIHIGDYQAKLQTASKIIEIAMKLPNRFQQLISLNAASGLIAAQDNKGAHIEAHIKAVATSKENQNAVTPMIQQFKQMQAQQDEMMKQISQLTDELNQSMQDNQMKDLEYDHAKRMKDLEVEKVSQLNSIGLAKALEQKDLAAESKQTKMALDEESKARDIGAKQAKASIDITAQQKQNEIKLESAKNKTSKPSDNK